MELVSIIMPTYNRAYIIERAIQSIFLQTYTNWELIIVDDGSTDNTKEIIDRFNDSRIYYVQYMCNKGANHARNVGLNISKGNLIAFLDSDNIWKESYLEERIECLQIEHADIVFGSTRIYSGNQYGIFPKVKVNKIEDILLTMLTQNIMDTNTVCFKRDCYEVIGGFDETMLRLQDWGYFFRLLSRGEFKVVFSSKVLVESYLQKNSITRKAKYIEATSQMVELFIKTAGEKSFFYEVLMNEMNRLITIIKCNPDPVFIRKYLILSLIMNKRLGEYILKKINKSKRITLYGYNEVGSFLRAWLLIHGIELDQIVDRNIANIYIDKTDNIMVSDNINDIKIDNTLLVVAISSEEYIVKQLINFGCNDVVSLYSICNDIDVNLMNIC